MRSDKTDLFDKTGHLSSLTRCLFFYWQTTPRCRSSDQKDVKKFHDNPSYLRVEFAENGVQAAKIEAQMKKSGNHVQSFMKDRAAEEMYGTTNMQGLLYRTRNLANKTDEDELSASHRAVTYSHSCTCSSCPRTRYATQKTVATTSRARITT